MFLLWFWFDNVLGLILCSPNNYKIAFQYQHCLANCLILVWFGGFRVAIGEPLKGNYRRYVANLT